MVRPLEKLRAQMRRQVPPRPSTRLALSRPDEFGDLTHAFNDLLARLEEHARDKEAFVADLAHEFKNPVAAVRAAAEALEARSDDPERTRRLARTLHTSSVQLEELVTQFLELARAEAGFVGESREPVELAAIVRAVAADVGADPRWAELEVQTEIEADATVPALPWRIETAVRNLVLNACGFATTRVNVRLRVEDDAATIEVTDDGPGIEADDRERIFERFHSRRRGGGGTGLGLAIVRATALAHGGDVDVRSTVGKGATFGLRLPRD
jgi:two-component system sensor histidine kinase ChvG